jgi:hypothetical protein
MSDKRYQTFEEFWPFYVREHSKKATRTLHFIGTSAALAAVAAAVLGRKPWLLLAAPLAGYGFAWTSHFFVEKNRPATFTYPAWSLAADFKMWSKILGGTMDEEVARVLAAEADAAAAAAAEAPAADTATNGTNGTASHA